MQVEDCVIPVKDEYLPDAHAVHAAAPLIEAKVPAGHVEHESAFATENAPGSHGAHPVSTLALI